MDGLQEKPITNSIRDDVYEESEQQAMPIKVSCLDGLRFGFYFGTGLFASLLIFMVVAYLTRGYWVPSPADVFMISAEDRKKISEECKKNISDLTSMQKEISQMTGTMQDQYKNVLSFYSCMSEDDLYNALKKSSANGDADAMRAEVKAALDNNYTSLTKSLKEKGVIEWYEKTK